MWRINNEGVGTSYLSVTQSYNYVPEVKDDSTDFDLDVKYHNDTDTSCGKIVVKTRWTDAEKESGMIILNARARTGCCFDALDHIQANYKNVRLIENECSHSTIYLHELTEEQIFEMPLSEHTPVENAQAQPVYIQT
eukprot:UN07629